VIFHASSQRARRAALGAALGLLVAAALAAPAHASEAIDSFTTTTSTTAAGAHPDLSTSFTLHEPGSPEAAQNVIFNAPQGLFGNPYAITHCTSADFALDQCPSNSQAGVITVYASQSGDQIVECIFEYGKTTAYGSSVPCSPAPPIREPTEVRAEATGLTLGETYHYRLHTLDGLGHILNSPDQEFISESPTASLYGNAKPHLLGTAPIFDVEPVGTETALFAFIVPSLNIPINIPVAVRTGGDYGLRFTVKDISQSTPLAGADLTFWGFPADSSHDGQRFPKGVPGSPSNCPGVADRLPWQTPAGEHPRSPADRQPDHLRRAAGHEPHRADLPGPRPSHYGREQLSGDDRLPA
jgi:hypothetical protein